MQIRALPLGLMACFVLSSIASAQIPAIERDALIALYNSMNGAGWTDKGNWRNAGHTDYNDVGTECTLYGVSCSGRSVVELDLGSNDIIGVIFPEIGNLTYLLTFDFDFTYPFF
jgi:hypothetical protein